MAYQLVFIILYLHTINLRCCEGTSATKDERCFSFSFSNVEELREKMMNDTKLREHLRKQIIDEMQQNQRIRDLSSPEETTQTSLMNSDDAVPLTTDGDASGLQTTIPTATAKESTTTVKSICVSHESNMTNWNITYSSCISISKKLRTYKDAKSYCQDIGGRLAAKGIRDGSIVAYLNSSDWMRRSHFWIGLHFSSGNWKWSDNSTYVKDNTIWDTDGGQPQDNNENCALLLSVNNWKIHDYACTPGQQHMLICEK